MSTQNGIAQKEDSSLTFEQFLALHKNQLQSSCVPELYWQTLFIKLKNEVMGFRELIDLQVSKLSNSIIVDF